MAPSLGASMQGPCPASVLSAPGQLGVEGGAGARAVSRCSVLLPGTLPAPPGRAPWPSDHQGPWPALSPVLLGSTIPGCDAENRTRAIQRSPLQSPQLPALAERRVTFQIILQFVPMFYPS